MLFIKLSKTSGSLATLRGLFSQYIDHAWQTKVPHRQTWQATVIVYHAWFTTTPGDECNHRSRRDPDVLNNLMVPVQWCQVRPGDEPCWELTSVKVKVA